MVGFVVAKLGLSGTSKLGPADTSVLILSSHSSLVLSVPVLPVSASLFPYFHIFLRRQKPLFVDLCPLLPTVEQQQGLMGQSLQSIDCRCVIPTKGSSQSLPAISACFLFKDNEHEGEMHKILYLTPFPHARGRDKTTSLGSRFMRRSLRSRTARSP